MNDTSNSNIHYHSEQGVTAEHQHRYQGKLVTKSKAIKNASNVFINEIHPIACWRINDILFDFGEAFIRKEAKNAFIELKALHKLIKRKFSRQFTENPLFALFGHADPVGNDQPNKKLSEKRAGVVYGVITRNAEVWKSIFQSPAEVRYLQTSLKSVSQDTGLVDGVFGEKTKKAVELYIEELCPADLKFTEKDFIGDGTYAFQGCSEFNPVLMFSEEEFKFTSKEERDVQNEPNRRVVGFFFKAGTIVTENTWPCRKYPNIQSCKTHFFPNWKSRREFLETRREQKINKDTFCCKFYDKLASLSPCEDVYLGEEEKWGIDFKGYEVYDLGKAELNQDDCEALKKMYPPKHSLRKYLHLDFGISADYSFQLEVILRKRNNTWYCHKGIIKSAEVLGTQIQHTAFSEYYAKPGVHPDSTVSWKAEKYRVELEGMDKISKLKNKKINLEFIDEPMDIKRHYIPSKHPSKFRRQYKGPELVFDWHHPAYDLRPGKNVDKYKKFPHFKIRWPYIDSPEAIVYDKNTGKTVVKLRALKTSYVLTMADPRFNHWLNESDHILPLKDGAEFVFFNLSLETTHETEYRDTPFYYCTYDFRVELLSK